MLELGREAHPMILTAIFRSSMLWKSLRLKRLCVDFNAQRRPIRKLQAADNLEAEREVTQREEMGRRVSY